MADLAGLGLVVSGGALGLVVALAVWVMDKEERTRLLAKLSMRLRQEEVDREEDAAIETLERIQQSPRARKA
jgi:hypothetical protein